MKVVLAMTIVFAFAVTGFQQYRISALQVSISNLDEQLDVQKSYTNFYREFSLKAVHELVKCREKINEL